MDKVRALTLKVEQHQRAGHNRHRFGSMLEGLDLPNLTFEEDGEISEAAEAHSKPVTESEEGQPARRHSRKPLSDHLERHDAILSPGEQCRRCGGAMKTLGEDVTEELDYVPGRFVVHRIIRPRKACACCEAIAQSPLPSHQTWPPRSGLLAHVLVSKYSDHLPLSCQSQVFAREGVDLARSTLADRVGRSTALLEPLAHATGRMVRKGEALFLPPLGRLLRNLLPGNGRHAGEDAGAGMQIDQNRTDPDMCQG